MPPQALAAVATLLSFAVHGNRIEFTLDHGAAELTWVSDSTFRFRRSLDGPLPAVAPLEKGSIRVQADDLPGAVRLRSKRIEASILKRGLLVSVRGPDGELVMSDLSEPRAIQGGVEWDRAMPPGVRYYGLGVPDEIPDLDLDWRGKTTTTGEPLLISTAGHGEYHVRGSEGGGLRAGLRFDFTAADRYRIQAPSVD